jgi:ATP-dependent helicase/nuclease subunit B
VLQETGGAARPALSDLGKRMVIAALLERHRRELAIFGPVADRLGLPPRLATSLHELRAHGVTPEKLRERAHDLEAERGGPTSLSPKARDLALLDEALADHCAERFIDPDVYLGLLVARLERSSLVRGARVWIDGFAGFTPAELEVVGGLLTHGEQVSVTLLLDAKRERTPDLIHDKTYLFRPSLETDFALQALARKLGVRVEPPVLLTAEPAPPRFRAAPELAHLEATFFEAPRAVEWKGAAPRITVRAEPRRRDEVESAAREILRLARGEGVRYRHMAVVLRDLESYAELVEAVFADHGIPVFVDRRRPIPHHPLVELIRAAVEVLAWGWSHEAVFRYLRTDLVPIERDAVDRLESYALTHGVRGEVWYRDEPWAFVRRYSLEEERELDRETRAALARLDAERRRAVKELDALRRRLGGASATPVRALVEALWELLVALDVPATLARWSDESESAGQPERAREHRAAWRQVVALLDELVAALGDQPSDLDGFLRIVEAGLESLDLGLIPPGLDSVVVGTIERSRHLGTRAAFVLGAVDGAYPPEPREDPILGDADRDGLAEGGLALGATARERLLHESYFAYLTLTRASEWLWVSHPLADDDGRSLEPANAVRRLLETFPRRAAEPADADDAALARVARPRDLGALVARRLRVARDGEQPPERRWLALAAWIAGSASLRAESEVAFRALDYEGDYGRRMAPLEPALARALYASGDGLRTSVSRLESFTACPFQHFAGHGLGLAERPRASLEPADLGSLNHAVLSGLVRGLERDGRPWAELSPVEARERVRALVAELVPRLKSEVVLDDPQARYLLGALERVLDGSVELLGEHARRARFTPLAVELPFGERRSPGGVVLPPLEIALGGGLPAVALRGRIDRVDLFVDDGGTPWARVIDYKRRPRGLADARVFHGLDLQLLTYLLAITTHGGALTGGRPVKPAAALYFPVHDPLPLFDARPVADVAAKRWRTESRMKGLVVDDRDVLLAMGAEPDGPSPLLPVEMKKDGTLSKRATAASPADFERLFRHVRGHVRETATRILSGEVAVKPYKLGRDQTPCGYCPARPVCQFDPAVANQGYDELEGLGRGELLARLAAEGAGGADGDVRG